MKKSTLFTGYLAAFIFLFAIIFKSMHWQGAGVLFVISIVLFSILYAVPLYMEKNKLAESSFMKLFNLIALFMMFFVPVGFLFKMMHWPYAGYMIYAGLTFLMIGIPFIIVKAVKVPDQQKLNYHNEAVIFILLAGISIFMIYGGKCPNYLSTLNQSGHTIVAEMKYNEAKSNDLYAILENTVKTTNSGAQYLEKATIIKNASDSLILYITGMEKYLFESTLQPDANPDSLETITSMVAIEMIDTILFGNQQKAKEFKEKLISFKVLVEASTNSRGKDIITTLFNTDDPKPVEADTLSWEDVYFGKKPLTTVILTFNQFKSNIRLLEAETMVYLQAMAAISKQNVVAEPEK